MNNFNRWAMIVGALLLAGIVGAIAYNVGVTQGVEQSGKIIAAPPGAYPYHGWHRPWGGGFFFAPLLFIAFWFLVIRGLFWRGGWHGPHGRYGRLEDWHRREHERTWNEPSGGASGAPGER